MKCIRCNHDCKYPERPNKKCPSCRGEFAFEPRTGDPVTDTAFKNAIDAVSSFGSVRFLPDHVYYEIGRRKRRKATTRNVLWGIGAGALAVGVAFSAPGAAVPAAIAAVAGLFLWPYKTISLTRSEFDALWQRWLRVHGAPSGVIVRKEQQGPYRGPVDIPNYSFDRAVICDSAETVDVLLANNFHFENNCAVLSVTGYPAHAYDTVRAMLRQNPRLVVYALHDASRDGSTLAHRLATEDAWFKGRARVVEAGMRPAHAKHLRGLWKAETHPFSHPAVTKQEAKWLSSYSCELAAIRPEQVIKRLFAVISSDASLRPMDDYVSDGGGVWVDHYSFASDASASDGGDDAFG